MKHVIGNLVHLQSGVIVHQVNCQGVMGSGIAKELRDHYPAVFSKYHAKWQESYGSDQGASLLGQVQWVRVKDDLWVVNLFGQQFYGRDGRRYTSYDALDDGFKTIGWMLPGKDLTAADVHHPLIGCGLGGADWSVVKTIIEHRLGHDTTLWTLD